MQLVLVLNFFLSLCPLSGGERSLVIVMGFAYLFVSMMVLIVSEDVLESGLDQAYADFNNSAAVFLADNAGLDSQVRNNNFMSINRFASDFLKCF